MIGDLQAASAIASAKEAYDEILAEIDPARREKLINGYQPRWVAFRTHFERIYGAKCWYTECVNPGTDDDIDHYRPKGRIFEDKEHGGYWWEALNWRNFRLSCHRANRLRQNPESGETLGKGDHFPLAELDGRWAGPETACNEKPLLLDPVSAVDSAHLTFEINGKVALSPRFANDDLAKRRFEASRAYLHLDWPAIKQQRQLLYADIARRVDDGNAAELSLKRDEPGARDRLDRVVGELIELAQPQKPYSRAAQSYIRYYRYQAWVEREVLPHIVGADPATVGAVA